MTSKNKDNFTVDYYTKEYSKDTINHYISVVRRVSNKQPNSSYTIDILGTFHKCSLGLEKMIFFANLFLHKVKDDSHEVEQIFNK
jgi:hypothetical protein